MTTPRTTPFTREELIELAKRVHAGKVSVIGHAPAMGLGRAQLVYEAEAMAAIVDVLENYPLAKFAEEVVNVVIGDLSMRRGFDDLILTDSFRDVRRFLVELVARTVVGPVNPFPNRFQKMLRLQSPEELAAICPVAGETLDLAEPVKADNTAELDFA